MANKNELIQNEEAGYIQVIDQSGIENAIEKLVLKNNSLLPNNVSVERIKNSAGFYIANRDDLMTLDAKNKMNLLYGVLKEAMLGLEAGKDYDIVPFKGKPVFQRSKNGWYSIIDLVKPAEIIRFTNNVVFKGDDFEYNPVTEDIKHTPKTTSDKYEDIEYAYAYIRFANGFEKTIVMSKKDLDSIRRVSPSANTTFSPWTTMPVKMVKTKAVKELAKELFTLFGNRINTILSQAIESDEQVVQRIDNKGYIISDNSIYENKVVSNEEQVAQKKPTKISLSDIE